ncbi:MFS transporter [Phenylobacterium sp.]|uniref:MFS transporter n=1 Tax=Phenylobacterium sp. TaxID=1871053 RepID=UPI003563875E
MVIATGALTSATLAPVLVGLYIDDLKLTAGLASLAVAAENLAYACGLLLFYVTLHKLPRRRLATAGLAVMIVSSLVTAGASGFWALILIRTVFGLALGLAASTVFAAFAARPDPQKAWGLANFINLTYAAALLSASGWISEHYGLIGIATVLAVVAAIGLACTSALPPRAPAVTATHRAQRSPPTRSRAVPATCGVLALFFLYAGHTTLWSFQERMGVNLGMSRTQVGFLLGVSVLGAILGSGAALLVSGRWGRLGPSVAAYAGLLASTLLLAASSQTAYIAGAILIKTAWFFGLPFVLGAVARLDPTGRWSTLGAAMLAFGSALGPALAAPVAQFGMSAVALLAAGFYALSLVLTFPLFRADSVSGLPG